ncbi:hypothetical protein [Gordonia sp. UCD-TK1]|uniref:hypothetical protein n=1 Tax=unclassified Gordonia (in: high G+C Gram-positive bacteria) TaxID=2657482 RepID=UPI00080DA467|nr:hypothetical protein [Gordonia sp. UCD-TK1]OCH79000.1 hypothetical protein A9310_09970 [Gordonia sp. UCD-TK1]
MTNIRRPAEWRGGRITGVLFVALMAPAVVALLVTALRSQDVPTVFVAVTFALGMCAFLAGGLRTRVFEQVQPNVDTATGRLTLRYDQIFDRLSRAALALGAAGGIVFVALVPMGKLDLSLTPGQRTFFPLAVGVTVVAAVYAEYARHKHGPPRITLDVDAVTLNRTSSQTPFRWADITRMDAERIGSWPKRDVVYIETTEASKPYVLGDAPCYTPGGAALYSLLRFYWLNPESRIELSDGRAAARLAAEDFVDTGR